MAVRGTTRRLGGRPWPDHRREAGPVGDPLSDLALTEIWNSGTPLRVADFIRRFAKTPELHEWVRAYMVAGEVIRRTWRRRFWFFKT